MVVAVIIVCLAGVAAFFFGLWQNAKDDRQEVEREAARQLVEADESRGRAADALKRVRELEANSERLTEKIANLYRQVEARDAQHEVARKAWEADRAGLAAANARQSRLLGTAADLAQSIRQELGVG